MGRLYLILLILGISLFALCFAIKYLFICISDINKIMKKCIIHYPGYLENTYSKLKDVTSQNEKRIRIAKSICENLGGLNYHHEQCVQVPDVIDNEHHVYIPNHATKCSR